MRHMRRFFQIRNNDKPVNQRLYATLNEAGGVLVRNHASDCEVVELEAPRGAVLERFKFVECQQLVENAQGTS